MTIVTQQSGYNLDELRALTLRQLRVRDTSRYSPTEGSGDYEWVDDAINRGQSDFVRRTLCLRTYAAVELKAATRVYRLPWNFIDFMAAYYYDSSLSNGYKELGVTTVEQLNWDVNGWRTATGTPEKIYIDRIYGNTWMFGVYPTPTESGETITYDSEYGVVTSWVCPLYTYNQEYSVVISQSDLDQFLLNTDAGQIPAVTSLNKNILFEYYRLPEKLLEPSTTLGEQGVINPEIPKEYHHSLSYYAASDLLRNNPEDSVEYKRSILLQQQFEMEVKTYIGKRKKPISGLNLRATSFVWNWMDQMDFYAGIK